MKIKDKIKEILFVNFDFVDDTDELILRSQLSSLNFIKFILILENEFGIFMDGKDSYNINSISKMIEENLVKN